MKPHETSCWSPWNLMLKFMKPHVEVHETSCWSSWNLMLEFMSIKNRCLPSFFHILKEQGNLTFVFIESQALLTPGDSNVFTVCFDTETLQSVEKASWCVFNNAFFFPASLLEKLDTHEELQASELVIIHWISVSIFSADCAEKCPRSRPFDGGFDGVSTP